MMGTMANSERDRAPEAETPPGAAVSLALLATGGFGVVAAMGALLLFGGRAALGVAVGSIIAVANLWVFKKLGEAFLGGTGSRRAAWGVIGALKFVALLLGVGLLLKYRLVDGVPLVVGYGALPVGITLSTFMANQSGGA